MEKDMRILHVIAQLPAFVANAKQRNGFRCNFIVILCITIRITKKGHEISPTPLTKLFISTEC